MNEKLPTILVPGRLNQHSVDRIGREFDMICMDKARADAVTADIAARVRGIASMTDIVPDFIDALPGLEIIANFGVGYDDVDAEHAAKRNIMVTNTPDVLSEEVADTTIGLLINTVRELPKAEQYLRAGRWESDGIYPLTKGSLRGRKAGIFGLGRIGLAVARRLEASNVPVSYYNRRKRDDVSYDYHPTLTGLAAAVDILICVAPGGPGTENAIGKEVLEALGPDGILINVGRGSSVDEPALVKALTEGTIMAAGLDVFAREPHVPPELIALPNASLLPHVASASLTTRQAMADLQVDNLVSWFKEGEAITPVPETRSVKKRG